MYIANNTANPTTFMVPKISYSDLLDKIKNGNTSDDSLKDEEQEAKEIIENIRNKLKKFGRK
jgi:hypothetical protein